MKHINSKGAKRIQVTFNVSQWKLISSLKGYLGQNDAEVVRNIVLAWLSEKSFVSSSAKRVLSNDEKH